MELLKLEKNIEDLLTKARESRNELTHESTLSITEVFYGFGQDELEVFLQRVRATLNIIRDNAIISTIMSLQNNDSIAEFQFTKVYEDKVASWVMERFEK